MDEQKSLFPIALWFAFGVLLIVVLDLMDNPFITLMLGFPVLLCYVGLGVLLLVSYVRHAIKQRDKRSWLAAASIAPLIVLLVAIEPLIIRTIRYAEFAFMLPSYSRTVEAVTHGPYRAFDDLADDVQYSVDYGTPIRVAFPKGGIIDNWYGVVYDPSDEVAQAKGADFGPGGQGFTAPPEVRALFGGDLVSCWRIYRHYHMCSFT